MISCSLSEVATRLDGRLIGEDATFAAVGTDTRTIAEGALFVALTGPNFDGHDYLDAAGSKGAVGAMVSRQVESGLPQILVQDTRLGLGRLASLWRQSSGLPLVAVTGSNGKTTVKEMIAAILGQKGRVLATRGNLNNDIGMPLTLLRIQDEDYAVIEMGANHPGEIGYLSRIAGPDVVLLNNAGRAHLEGFGSLEAVARAKGEIILGLGEKGSVIFNGDDRWAPLWRELAAGHRQISFGMQGGCDVYSPADEMRIEWGEEGFVSRFPVYTPEGGVDVRLALAGEHNRMNALGAIAAAQEMGASLSEISEGLASIAPVKGRLQMRQGPKGVRLIDDSYNANPDSVTAAIDVLASAPGRRFLVLGGLAEMGTGGESFYREMGEAARRRGIECLWTMDQAAAAARAFGKGGRVFADRNALTNGLHQELRAGDQVLVKGSRSAGMEQVINALATGEAN